MSLFPVLSVGASGMAAQRARAEVLVENLPTPKLPALPEAAPIAAKTWSSNPPPSVRHSRPSSAPSFNP